MRPPIAKMMINGSQRVSRWAALCGTSWGVFNLGIKLLISLLGKLDSALCHKRLNIAMGMPAMLRTFASD